MSGQHEGAGEREPVVLLNGGMMSFTAWDEIASRLVASFTVIRCDFRGQLRTPEPPPADFLEHAEDVAALLDHFGVASAHVAGTSFGGEVALVLAARHPRRVRSLALIAVVDRFSDDMLGGLGWMRRLCREALDGGPREAVYDAIASFAFSDEYKAAHAAEIAERRRAVSLLPDTWFRGLDGLLASLLGLDLGPLLPSIAAPTLFVLPGEDRAMPRERLEAAAAAVPGAESVVVEGAGHALVAERPAETAEIITKWIKEVS